MENKNIIVIGDVHGKVNSYKKILDANKEYDSIQVGDFGFSVEHRWHLSNIDSNRHKVNFGNHDDYKFLNKNHSKGDYSIDCNIMTVRGAYSIDQYKRIKDVDWWENEELTYSEFVEASYVFSQRKPKIMITHDCPHEVRKHFFGIEEKSMTSNGLQSMFELHQPDIWIFGHHHRSKNEIINGTRFVCLSELEVYYI